MKILAVTCPNGLGHFRRVIDVLHALSSLLPDLAMEIVCSEWQKERMSNWDRLKDLQKWIGLQGFRYLPDPGVLWSNNPGDYSDGRLRRWVHSLDNISGIHEADLVLSDNLAGVLQIRSDAVLMGSFLWSDVLGAAFPNNREVEAFVAWEQKLLARCYPPMLCVETMMMPGVEQRTQAVPLSWMRRSGDRPHVHRDNMVRTNPRAAVLIGATGMMENLIGDFLDALLEYGVDLSLPKRLYMMRRDQPGVSLFTFNPKDFLSSDFALCRPGLGTIHDCIFYGIPMAFVPGDENIELTHNRNRIEAMNLGICLDNALSPSEFAEQVSTVLNTEKLLEIRQRMAEIPMKGVDQAAQWLQNRLLK